MRLSTKTGASLFLVGALCGALGSWLLTMHTICAVAGKPSHQPDTTQPLVVRLHRFKLRPDRMPTFSAWVNFEHAHHAETLRTLAREHMYSEAIFRDPEQDPDTIFWLEIRGSGGASSGSSPLSIDKQYELFERETLLPHSHAVLSPEYTLIAPFIQEAIAQHGDR